MISVGITGNFASGKSFILSFIESKGIKTFSADEEVGALYKDPAVQNEILKMFPDIVRFDKKNLANLIYNNSKERDKLEKFIHPLVISKLETFKEKNKSEKVIFAETPLLFEAKLEKYFDFTVTVICSEKSRLERAKSRQGFDQAIYDQVAKIQLPQQEKVLKSHFVINTDVSLAELESQITKMMEKLQCI